MRLRRPFGAGDVSRHVIDDLSAYLDDELMPSQRAQVEAHLAACDHCQTELADLRRTVQLLRAVPASIAPRSFRLDPNVVRRPTPIGRYSPLFYSLRQATGALAAVLVAVIGLNLAIGPPAVLRPDPTSGASLAAPAATALPAAAPPPPAGPPRPAPAADVARLQAPAVAQSPSKPAATAAPAAAPSAPKSADAAAPAAAQGASKPAAAAAPAAAQGASKPAAAAAPAAESATTARPATSAAPAATSAPSASGASAPQPAPAGDAAPQPAGAAVGALPSADTAVSSPAPYPAPAIGPTDRAQRDLGLPIPPPGRPASPPPLLYAAWALGVAFAVVSGIWAVVWFRER